MFEILEFAKRVMLDDPAKGRKKKRIGKPAFKKAVRRPRFPSFEVTSRIIGFSALVAALLGIVASIMPAIAVAKMSVTEGLKTLD